MNSGAQIGLSSWLMFGLSFLAVLAAMVAVFFAMRRFFSRFAGAGSAPRMRIIENLAVGPRQRMILLRVCDHQILVGVTQQQITMLAKWEGGEDDAKQPAALSKGPQLSARQFLFERRSDS